MYTVIQIGDDWAIVNSLGTVLRTFDNECDARAFMDYVSN